MRGSMKGVKIFAGLIALMGWTALLLQAWLLVGQMGLGEGLWRFLGYFTILTNIGVAVVASLLALGHRGALTRARARLVFTAAIIFVGAAYWALLAGLWQPTGWQLVADIILHTLQPILFALLWWRMHDGNLRTRDAAAAMGWPLGYAGYALLRGANDDWYAYWFLDPEQQGLGGMSVSLLALSFAFFLLAWGMSRLPPYARSPN